MLFLDEFTGFRGDAIEGLRQPLEDGHVVVTRMVGSVEFPSRFTLVVSETDPAVLKVFLKVKPGLGEGYHWWSAARAAPPGRFHTSRASSDDPSNEHTLGLGRGW